MTLSAQGRRRTKISATVNAELLQAVDRFVREHPGSDRSKVLDDALRLWCAHQQEQAMREQYADDGGVDPEEWVAWCAIRDAAAERSLRRWNEKDE